MSCFNLLKEQLNNLCPQLDLRVDEPLERHTSFHIGGPAALMALPATQDEAVLCVRTAAKLGIEPFFMGNGSNLLVGDDGIERFIIKSANLRCCEVQGSIVTADSGVTLARLAVFAREQGLTGLEFAHGIPGTLGGAVTMNAGAYGGEMAQVVRQVTVITKAGEVEMLYNFDFGYRRSAFYDGSRMILSAQLELAAGEREQIAWRMEELAARRQSKQPLEYPSAGSMFKRPEGYFAAALIDQCGLKGFTVGGAQVSEKHAGFVVNRGGATCADVLELVKQVKARVLEQTGVALEMEVKVLD
ncbi:MAG: UDP-N-acetylmuramate dehydrogenase [Ruminococcaceae bacterium]|nr:UDP-N-acetylmuramate dehydrogenase [Oscillospiraceae bacterium]